MKYYENYRRLSEKIALIQGQLQFFAVDDERGDLLRQLDEAIAMQNEISENLEHYVPLSLPCRSYFRALEEREFLFYRCIKGLTMDQTALLMCVSRDTAYRIRRRIASYEGTRSPFASGE